VVAAKLAAAAVTGLVMALLSSASVLAARVAGLAAAVALFAVLGVGLAALLGNQVAAVVGQLWWSQGAERLLLGPVGQPGLERWLPMGRPPR
jgi:hypothetical protein